MKFLSLLATLLFSCTFSFSQTDHKRAFQLVLEGDAIGKEYSFGRWDGNTHDSLVLVFLGEVKTNKGRLIKILTSRWYWGLSFRATSRIILFSQKNEYLGDYRLTMNYDLPDKIEDNALIFVNDPGNDCTHSLVKRISFKKGIPKRFFLRCKEKLGDIYSFEQNL
jgi:hypothetical protein